jgi:hypothetical protein
MSTMHLPCATAISSDVVDGRSFCRLFKTVAGAQPCFSSIPGPHRCATTQDLSAWFAKLVSKRIGDLRTRRPTIAASPEKVAKITRSSPNHHIMVVAPERR